MHCFGSISLVVNTSETCIDSYVIFPFVLLTSIDDNSEVKNRTIVNSARNSKVFGQYD